jgi:hypothetical protein
MVSLYASLTPEHEAQLPSAASLERLERDFRKHSIADALLSEAIGPTSVVTNHPLFTQTSM